MTGYLFQGQGRSFIMSAFSRIPREPLIKSTMNRVAIKNGMIARHTTQAVAAHRHVTGAASRLREVRHRPPLPHLRYAIPGRGGILRSQGVQQRKRLFGRASKLRFATFSMQPFGTTVLRAVCGVRLLVKGMAINFEAFLASHPAKPLSRRCGT